MNFSEQPPSNQWAPLKHRGETLAEVWFKPEGEAFALAFRIPRSSFQIPGVGQQLTTESLLKAVGIAAAEVESWRQEDATDSGAEGSDSELRHPLSPPPQDADYLILHVHLKPPAPADDDGGSILEIPESKWEDLAARWKAVLEMESGIDSMRLSMENLRNEMEASMRRTLNTDEKLNAPNADVLQWNKAKSRVHYALPKVREFIHRATWAGGAAERKRLEAIFENHIRPRIPFPEVDQAAEQMDGLFKDRQLFSAQGASVYRECKGVVADVQTALRTMQTNAAAKGVKNRGETRTGGKLW